VTLAPIRVSALIELKSNINRGMLVSRRVYHIFLTKFVKTRGGTKIMATLSNGRLIHPRVTVQENSRGMATRAERQLTAIDRITTHHTVTSNMVTLQNLNNIWVGNNWNRAGYHFIVRNDGSIWQLVPLHAPSWGAGAVANPRSIHIAIAGTFTPTNLPSQSARDSYAWLVQTLLQLRALPNLTRQDQNVGHRDWMATACPGFTNAQFRSWVAQAMSAQPSAPNNNPNQIRHTIISGDTLWGLSQRFGVTAAQIRTANNLRTDVLQVGQVLVIPSGQPSRIVAGQTVRVNTNATTWATGQSTPNWVRGSLQTVQEVRDNGSILLLSGVMSLIRASDVTVV